MDRHLPGLRGEGASAVARRRPARALVLSPNYVYPNSRDGIATTIKPRYRVAHDWLGRVRCEKGSRSVKVDCADGATIPAR